MGRTLQFEEMALRIQPAGPPGLCTVQVTQSSYGAKASCEADLSSWLRHDQWFGAIETAIRGGVEGSDSRNLTASAARAVTLSPQTFGDDLFRAVFKDEVLKTFLRGLGRVETNPDTGLRIRLQFDPSLPELPRVAALPWELLYHADNRDFLARNPLTPLVRYLEVARLTTRPCPASPLRILLVRARPRDLPALDLGTEQSAIAEALAGSNILEIHFLDPPTLREMRRRLVNDDFHVIHFMGHGDFDRTSGEGTLIFEDSHGNGSHLSGRVLAEVLKGSRWLRLVVLNACETAQLPRRLGQDPFTGVASALIQAGLPAVLAMQFPISDRAALAFSHDFYTALAAGFPVDAAAADSRAGVYAASPNSWEWAIPALYMNVPDGRILEMPERPHRDRATETIAPARAPELDPTTLTELAKLDALAKLDLLRRYQARLGASPHDPDVLLTLGLVHLDLRLYDQALAFLTSAVDGGCRAAELHFYRALALLHGEQPRRLGLAQLRAVEAALRQAQAVHGDSAEALALSAIIKHDYYRSQGLRVPPPPIDDLLAAAHRCPPREDWLVIGRHVTLPFALRALLPDSPRTSPEIYR